MHGSCTCDHLHYASSEDFGASSQFLGYLATSLTFYSCKAGESKYMIKDSKQEI